MAGTLNIQGVVDSRHCHIYNTLFCRGEGDLWEHSIPVSTFRTYLPWFVSPPNSLSPQPCAQSVSPFIPLAPQPPSLSPSIQLFGTHRLACAQRRVFSLEVGNYQLSNSIFSPQSENQLVKLSRYEAILPVFQGNMLYFLLVFVEEYLDVWYRWVWWAIRLNLAKYLNIQILYFARVKPQRPKRAH